MNYEIIAGEERIMIVEAKSEHEAISKYNGTDTRTLSARLSPEELADFRAWSPSKEQAEEYFRQFPVYTDKS